MTDSHVPVFDTENKIQRAMSEKQSPHCHMLKIIFFDKYSRNTWVFYRFVYMSKKKNRKKKQARGDYVLCARILKYT